MTATSDAERMADQERQLEQERAKVASLERFIEEKSQSLFLAQRSLDGTHGFLRGVLDALPNALIVLDRVGDVVDANEQARSLSGYAATEIVGMNLRDLLHFPTESALDPTRILSTKGIEAALVASDGEEIPVLFHGSELKEGDDRGGFVCIATDLRERQALESQLREAHKLESVGQLAAGIAHELNTPIQFVSDSVSFLRDAFDDLERVRGATDALLAGWLDDPRFYDERAKLEAIKNETDFEFLIDEIPDALRRCQTGAERVSTIVRAIKRFSHPGGGQMAIEDVNEAVEAAVIMASSEYKYVADLQMTLGDVPPIPCDVSELHQVFLNLLVNATHAIQDARAGIGGMGRIEVVTRLEGEDVVVEIADDGIGIEPEVRDRVFEPFFTTKCVGRGTGQGLALARSVIVDRHRGKIEIESVVDAGTRFVVRLPATRGEIR